jgi:nicotinamide-nucleotide amidase
MGLQCTGKPSAGENSVQIPDLVCYHTTMDQELLELAEAVGRVLKARGDMFVSAESCTGGWIGRAITAVPGSSHWYDRGFITYTNQSKQEMLGVSADTLEREGAVSEATVREMAEGALDNSAAQVSLAVSGIAGPGGGSEAKPVGTVFFAWAEIGSETLSSVEQFTGDRESVRRQAVIYALRGLLDYLGDAD